MAKIPLAAVTGLVIFQAAQSTLEFVVLLGMSLGAFTIIGRRLRKWARAIDVMLGLPAWQQKVDGRHERIDDLLTERASRFARIEAKLGAIDKCLDAIDKRFDVIAQADKHRIADALAGDERAPADRRTAPPA